MPAHRRSLRFPAAEGHFRPTTPLEPRVRVRAEPLWPGPRLAPLSAGPRAAPQGARARAYASANFVASPSELRDDTGGAAGPSPPRTRTRAAISRRISWFEGHPRPYAHRALCDRSAG